MWCADPVRLRPVAAVLTLAALLAGCSDIYYDRRETILFGAQDAVAGNAAIHTVDPWPKAAADRNIPGQGTTVAIAAERYRRGRVLKPQGLGTTSTWRQTQGADGAPTVAGATSGGETVKE